MATGNINDFDLCQPPICPDDITIDIISIVCVTNILYVRYYLIDNTGGNALSNLNFNQVLWSCNNQNFDNTTSSSNGSPYIASINLF